MKEHYKMNSSSMIFLQLTYYKSLLHCILFIANQMHLKFGKAALLLTNNVFLLIFEFYKTTLF